MTENARSRALAALLALDQGRIDLLDQVLEPPLPDPREAALARELALGAVRFRRLYDWLCQAFLRPGAQPPPLLAALRLGCHQLFACDRIPPHAAVGATIDALRDAGHGRLGGVANAVLRRCAALRQEERRGEGPLGRLAADHQPAVPAVRHSLPDLLVEHLAPLLVPGERELAALDEQVPLCTRSRPGVPPLLGRSIVRREGAWTWWRDPAEALAGPVADGRCVVQDASQGEVVAAARPRPGELVLDLCAAPGGKSRAFADAGCRVVSAELQAAKCRELAADRFTVVRADGRRPPFAAGSFDVVLVDAPCSNSGVLARRPEARWRYSPETVASLAALQRALLAAAAPLVRPGGRLVYATCSLTPAENQAVAQGLPGWRLLAERLSWPGAWTAGGYVAVLVAV
ncbi:MAG: rRNA cytosine-C5-methyltransferase [Planctomycetes bacterium]|nr:rRNA cytosine-C5-methyltransferase [Planctomycetota bacterium]